MDSDTDKRYGTKDLACMLGVEAVTIRKYAGALEKAGYIVDRSGNDRRQYSEKDAMVFRQLKALRDRNAMNVETAAMVVASKHLQASETVALSVHSEENALQMRYEKRFDELGTKVDKLMDINMNLLTRLEQREEWESKRDRQLMDMLREIRETKQQLAASQEERKRSSWLHRWFGRKP